MIYIIAAVLVVAMGTGIFFGCEKENNIDSKNNNIKTQKSIDFNIDFSEINLQNGMLCFNSWEHYESVMEALETACDNYTNDFFQSLKAELGENVESDELNDSADARGFNQFYPLHVFCDSLNFNSLYEYLESVFDNKKKYLNFSLI